ncbi:MAG: class I SAM-dependent methyltransferase [Planctomycetes bacterium]|nr:class I SAM-dependent methyltransferase [Planctomycetota bacterium]
MPTAARGTGDFFNDYARGFDSIYGKRRPVRRFLDACLRRSMRLRFNAVLAGCRPLENMSVLDIGCGPGRYSTALALAGASHVVGIDIAEEMLVLARKHAEAAGIAGRCDFIRCGLDSFNPPSAFDYVVVMGVMDYVRDAAPFCRKALSLARRAAFFSFPAADGLFPLLRKFLYRRRTYLHQYRRAHLARVFAELAPGACAVRCLAQDYFVSCWK